MLPFEQARHGLGKHEIRIEVGVVVAAAVARPPARIEGELHEVGEPRLSARSGRRAARQSAKLVQIDRRGAFRFQVAIEELEVRDLVVGVVVDVLGKVRIELLQLGGVDGISAAAGDLAVLDSAEFVVLHPEVAFEDLGRGGEAEHGRVALGQTAAVVGDGSAGRRGGLARRRRRQ